MNKAEKIVQKMKNKLTYPYIIRQLSQEDGGGFIVEFPDLPGCYADGQTIEEALKEAEDAVQSWLLATKQSGDLVPEPSSEKQKTLLSGRFVQRVPRTTHLRLQQKAKKEGVSINALVLSYISEGLSQESRYSSTVK